MPARTGAMAASTASRCRMASGTMESTVALRLGVNRTLDQVVFEKPVGARPCRWGVVLCSRQHGRSTVAAPVTTGIEAADRESFADAETAEVAANQLLAGWRAMQPGSGDAYGV